MASIGEFGTVHEEPESDLDPITFKYFGREISLVQTYDEVQLVDLMEASRSVDMRDPTSVVIVKDTLRLFIEPADFHGFWQAAKENRQTIEDLAAVMEGLLVTLTDRPTRQPSGSSAGRQPTAENSPDVLPTAASAGRPDLQVLLEGGAESRAKIAAAAAGA